MTKHKSSTLRFFDAFFLVLSVFGFLLSVASFLGGIINPIYTTFFVLPTLGIPFILAYNIPCLLYGLIRFNWKVLFPLAACLIQIPYVLCMWQPGSPYSQVLENEKIENKSELRVLTLNTEGFRTAATHEASWLMMARLLRDYKPDVVCFQEFVVHRDWDIQAMVSQVGYQYLYCPPEVHTAILSRFPILDTSYMAFEGTQNSAIWVDVAAHGRRIRVFNVHMQTMGISSLRERVAEYEPDISQRLENNQALNDAFTEFEETHSGKWSKYIQMPFFIRNNTQMRATQALWLRDVVDQTQGLKVICGDMNDAPSSFVYRTLSKDMRDGFREAGKGWASTFWGGRGLWRLDYILYSPQMSCRYYQALFVRCSDHKPVVADIYY